MSRYGRDNALSVVGADSVTPFRRATFVETVDALAAQGCRLVRTGARDWPYRALLLAHSTKSARRQREKDSYEPFDPGQVSGSSQWTDGARGAMTLTWRPGDYGGVPGERMLSIAKANYGRAHVVVPVEAVRAGSKDEETENANVGFKSAGQTWRPLESFKPGKTAPRGPPRSASGSEPAPLRTRRCDPPPPATPRGSTGGI